MKVLIATTSGFCHGVRRAMRIALQAAAHHGGLHADGPLVHNRQAVELLALRGVRTDAAPNAPVLIRAHGVPPERRETWQQENRILVDATCPRVAANQKLAEKSAKNAIPVLLAGDRDHAECQAIAGSANGNCLIIATPDDVETLKLDGPVLLMAQTTFSVDQFQRLAEAVEKRFPGSRIVDTICRATHDRQEETARLAAQADALVVVGGKHSANTNRLAEVGRAANIPVHLVETADELREEDFSRHWTVAVTSGASTPGWITQEVVNRLRRMGHTPFWSRAHRWLYPLVENRFTTAGCAAGLAMACSRYLTGFIDPLLAIAGAGFVFFAHTVNRRIPPNPEARRLSLADSYYQNRRSRFVFLAIMATAISLTAGFLAGSVPMLVIFALLFAGAFMYKQRQWPRNWPMAIGWALALAFPAAWQSGRPVAGYGAAVFVFLICLGGTLLRDLHDSASDHLMGIDTLPARIGHAASARFAHFSLLAALCLCFIAAAAWTFTAPAPFSPYLIFLICMALVPAAGLALLTRVLKGGMHDFILVQAGADGLGWLAGLLALGGTL